jgi:hypothetical protein
MHRGLIVVSCLFPSSLDDDAQETQFMDLRPQNWSHPPPKMTMRRPLPSFALPMGLREMKDSSFAW